MSLTEDDVALAHGSSESMEEVRCRQGRDNVLDQTCFALATDKMAAFEQLLKQPPLPNDGLRKLLSAPVPWRSQD